MKDKVLGTIKKYNLLHTGSSVLVALSGGADSMALIYIMLELKEHLGIKTIEAAHFNHMIRGSEADRDEQFVKHICESLGVRLHTAKADVPTISARTGEGYEECGRRLRYEFFERCSPADSKIATAHNLNDNAETMLINLIRGTGLKGLCGIPALRGRIIRPLLSCSRAEIEEYCFKNGINYVTDSTNLEDEYVRNKIRIHVLPILQEINGLALNNISLASQRNRIDEEFLEDECRRVAAEIKKENPDGFIGGILISRLKPIHASLLVRFLKMSVKEECGIRLSQRAIDVLSYMINSEVGRADIGGGYTASVRKGRLYIENYDKREIKSVSIDLSKGDFCTKGIKVSIIDAEEFAKYKNVNKKLLNFSLDYDKINPNLILRQRKEGDSITLARRNVTKSLKKLFNEANIAPKLRNSVPILAEENGKVVWVSGFGADRSAVVDENTQKAVIIELYQQ